MAHEHNDECKRLRDLVESLVARRGIPLRNSASDGVDVDLLPSDISGHAESDPSDSGNLDPEIRAARRALAEMGCEG